MACDSSKSGSRGHGPSTHCAPLCTRATPDSTVCEMPNAEPEPRRIRLVTAAVATHDGVAMTGASSHRYCIIGAGPAGLAQARAFKQRGVEFDVIERHRRLGGLWDIENPGSPMYE